MNSSNQKSTVVLITQDNELLSSISKSNTMEFKLKRCESIQSAIDRLPALIKTDIIILDIDGISRNTSAVIEQILELKKKALTQALIVVGKPDALAGIINSSIQPLIYRAFNKPIKPNQLFLSFESATKLHKELVQKQADGENLVAVGPIENNVTLDSISEQHRSKWVTSGALILVVIGVTSWFLFGNNSSEDISPDNNQVIASDEINDAATDENELNQQETTNHLDNATVLNELNQQAANSLFDNAIVLNKFNQQAATALSEGRNINPPENNALYYYDEALKIDPYNRDAYAGRNNIINGLEAEYKGLVDDAEFEQAINVLEALQVAQPLNTANFEIKNQLDTTVNSYINDLKRNGSAQEITNIVAMMDRIGPQLSQAKATSDTIKSERNRVALASSRSAAEYSQQESNLISMIDTAMEKDNIVPPVTNNAYSVITTAIEDKSISSANLNPKIVALNSKIVDATLGVIEEGRLRLADTYLVYIKTLGIDSENAALIEQSISSKRAELGGAGAGAAAMGQGGAGMAGMGQGGAMGQPRGAAMGMGMGAAVTETEAEATETN